MKAIRLAVDLAAALYLIGATLLLAYYVFTGSLLEVLVGTEVGLAILLAGAALLWARWVTR